MTFSFRLAQRDKTSLLIGLAGASGSGKTYSALRLATGLGGRIAFIDTEAGRGLHYADQFEYDHGELKAPFTPEAYREAIVAAEEAGYEIIIVDSMSHEYDGEGGLMDIQQEDLARMAKGDERKMERLTAPAWRNAKLRHKKMMARLLQCRAHLIFCLRAEEKIRFEKVKDEKGYERTAIVPAGWVPVVEKRFMYEMTCSFTLAPDAPGVPMTDEAGKPIHGKVQKQHQAAFPANQPISEDSGKRLAEWARGSAPLPPPEAGGAAPGTPSPSQSPPAASPGLPGTAAEYAAYADKRIAEFTTADALGDWWNSEAERELRHQCRLSQGQLDPLKDKVVDRHTELRAREDA